MMKNITNYAVILVCMLFSITVARAQDVYQMPSMGEGDDITACSGILQDPGGDSDYSNDTESIITISPANGSEITLFFEVFDMESGYDYLEIYDGSNTNSPRIGRYSGASLPNGGTINSTGGSITFKFTSDYLVNSDGFELSWECNDSNNQNIYLMPSSGNGEDITACSGTLKDPGGDDHYSNYTSSTVTIQPPGASTVSLNFSMFALESGYDHLYIYDGSSTNSPQIGSYTGSSLPENGNITSSGGALTFRFTTDGSVIHDGFELSWQCVQDDDDSELMPLSGVGEDITTCGGTLKDPGGDGQYYNNTDSRITINPESASFISINFEMFDFENSFDKLYIYDGSSTDSPLIGAYSGPSLPEGGRISSTGGAITFRLDSDTSATRDGFELTWECDANNSITYEHKKSSALSVYPNPATKHVAVQYEGNTNNTLLTLLDETGKTIYQKQISEGSDVVTTMDVSSYSAGVYIIRLEADHHVATKKLIIH